MGVSMKTQKQKKKKITSTEIQHNDQWRSSSKDFDY